MFDHFNRRRFMTTVAATWAGLGIADGASAGPELQATPACEDHDATLAETEGPFFKPRSPERSDLRDLGVTGTLVELTGMVLTRRCRPVERALVDLWHADDDGNYDNAGFRLRGHQFTDAQGRYRFVTIMPGAYEGRTRHYHVKVQPTGGRLLTTQLYFPGEAKNQSDGLFRSELVMKVAKVEEGLAGRFDFVLDIR